MRDTLAPLFRAGRMNPRAIIAAALSRICAVIEPAHSDLLLHLAAFTWAAAFFGFALSFGPLLAGADRRKARAGLAAERARRAAQAGRRHLEDAHS